MARLVCFNKPYGVLSQFTSAAGHPGLAGYLPIPGIYPIGRLDRDSEGLLVLTDDGDLQHRISQPDAKQTKVYWVQVENVVTEEALNRLQTGVVLRDGRTRPAGARVIQQPPLWPRIPPIRQRQHIPTTWLEVALTEGRNRQLRRMTAAVGHPTLRLIRAQVGPWQLGDLPSGAYRIETPPLEKPKHATAPRNRPRHVR